MKLRPDKIRVTDQTVYLRRPLGDEEKSPIEPKYVYWEGSRFPEKPDLTNHSIEDDEVRMGLSNDDGYLCIRLMPDVILGEVFINIQYVGKKGRWDSNMSRRNEALFHICDWITRLLSTYNTNWDVSIEAIEGIESFTRIQLPLAAQVLQGKLSLQEVLESRGERILSNREMDLSLEGTSSGYQERNMNVLLRMNILENFDSEKGRETRDLKLLADHYKNLTSEVRRFTEEIKSRLDRLDIEDNKTSDTNG